MYIVGESSNAATEPCEPKEAESGGHAANETKSHDWISQAASGWTAANSKALSMGAMYLLFGRPDKVSRV